MKKQDRAENPECNQGGQHSYTFVDRTVEQAMSIPLAVNRSENLGLTPVALNRPLTLHSHRYRSVGT